MARRHKIYMYFVCRRDWLCQFLLPDLQTTAAPAITFADPAKIVDMAGRGNAFKDLAAKQAMDYALNMGRGSVWLYLSDEQYAKLTTRQLSSVAR